MDIFVNKDMNLCEMQNLVDEDVDFSIFSCQARSGVLPAGESHVHAAFQHHH
jgi:hypothetical protein